MVWITVVILCVLLSAWSIGFIYQTSIVMEGERFFVLFDDAMISMQYARNWAGGEGLTWYPGERVEGYSNFGWVAVMAAVHKLDLTASQTCLVVQLIGIPVLWFCLIGTAVLARACRVLPTVAIIAVILVAAQYSLLYFTLFGMETGLVCALVTFGLAGHVDAVRRRTGCFRPQLWFAAAQLVRPDVLPIAVFAAAVVTIGARSKRLRSLWGLVVVFAVVLGLALWRHAYYGQWLPNTYHLKMTGWPLAHRVTPAIQHLLWAAVTLGAPMLLAACSVLQSKRWLWLVLGPFVIQLAYQTYVGGDAWLLNRFLVPGMPGLFVATAYGLLYCSRMVFTHPTRTRAVLARLIAVMIMVAAMNGVHWDHGLLLKPPQTTRENRLNLRLWRAVEQVAEPEACLAVAYAGVVPYFSNRHCYDILGKCDPHIARLPARREALRAGHNKFDVEYTLNQYNPDIVLHVLSPALQRDYRPVCISISNEEVAFFVRRNSPNVHVAASQRTTIGKAGKLISTMVSSR